MPDPIAPIQSFSTVPAHRFTQPKSNSGVNLGNVLGFAGKMAGMASGASPFGALAGGVLGGGAGGGVLGNLEGTLNGQSAQFAALLDLQQRIQMQSQVFTTATNVFRVDHDTRMSAIRNIRA